MKKEDIIKKLKQIDHPVLDSTLFKLGLIDKIEVKDQIEITIALPFQGIPIKGQIMNSIKSVLDNLEKDYKIEETIMDEEKRERFLEKEQKIT